MTRGSEPARRRERPRVCDAIHEQVKANATAGDWVPTPDDLAALDAIADRVDATTAG